MCGQTNEIRNDGRQKLILKIKMSPIQFSTNTFVIANKLTKINTFTIFYKYIQF